MHGSEEYAAEAYPQKCHRAEACAEYGTEYGPRAGNVEQLYEENPPPGQFEVVNTVGQTLARRGAGGICIGKAFEILAIGEVGRDEGRNVIMVISW